MRPKLCYFGYSYRVRWSKQLDVAIRDGKSSARLNFLVSAYLRHSNISICSIATTWANDKYSALSVQRTIEVWPSSKCYGTTRNLSRCPPLVLGCGRDRSCAPRSPPPVPQKANVYSADNEQAFLVTSPRQALERKAVNQGEELLLVRA